jgi:DNA polymerase
LWPELGKYGLKRTKFHVTNIVKCYPSETKTPTKIHIQKCMPWLQEEMKAIDCRLILAFGNTAIMAFLGEMGGISKKNGTVEWLDKWKCWICWCLHPASVAHNPNNKDMFQVGIKNFAETLKKLGGINEILF